MAGACQRPPNPSSDQASQTSVGTSCGTQKPYELGQGAFLMEALSPIPRECVSWLLPIAAYYHPGREGTLHYAGLGPCGTQ